MPSTTFIPNYQGIKNLSVELHPAITAFVGLNGCGKTRILEALKTYFHGKTWFYTLDLRALLEDSHIRLIDLGPTGYNLPSLLCHLRSTHPERFKRALQGAQAVVPELHREAVQPTPNGCYCRMTTRRGAFDILDRGLGKGSWMALGIFAALYAPRDPDRKHLLLFDDIEQHLYPRNLRVLYDQLNLAIDRQPGLQIAFSTHSPDLLDCMQPEQVRFVWSEEGGNVHCVPMEEHPDFDKWNGTMTPGEMWAVLGR